MALKNIFTIACLLLSTCIYNICTAKTPKTQYKLIWKDEFKGKSFNTNFWSKIPRGNVDWKRYMSDHEPLYKVKNGKLTLYGIANNDIVPNDTAKFLTGGLYTKNKITLRYGKVVIKARLQAAQGVWPAIWLLPETGKWPDAGEIDIMEHLNHDKFVYQTVHTYYTHVLNNKQNPPHSAKAKIKTGQYNIYAVEILPDKIIFSVNGKRTHIYPKIETTSPKQYPFGTPYYILIDMQIEGAWVGKASVQELPAKMEIDWIKIYERIINKCP